MSIESVLHEVQQLTEQEKRTVLELLQDHFADESALLSEEELGVVRARLEHYHAHPETGVPWEEMKQRHGL